MPSYYHSSTTLPTYSKIAAAPQPNSRKSLNVRFDVEKNPEIGKSINAHAKGKILPNWEEASQRVDLRDDKITESRGNHIGAAKAAITATAPKATAIIMPA